MIKMFTASWCTPCTLMKKGLDDADLEGVGLIDIDASPEQVKYYNVTSVPTFIKVDDDGQEVERQVGILSRTNFLAFKNG